MTLLLMSLLDVSRARPNGSHAPNDLHEASEVPNHEVISLRHIARQNDTLDRGERLEEQTVFGIVWRIGDPL